MSFKLPVVAAFDFDGTITYRDSLVPFLVFLEKSRLAVLGKLFWETPTLLKYLFGKASRQETKECVLKRFLHGRSAATLRQQAEAFAKGPLQRCVRPEALERLLWHQAQGHRCVLISANIDLFLEVWAKELKFDDCITSQCEVNGNGLLTGRLKGLNCWGEEKARRLNVLLGPRQSYILYVYGDSQGDREILKMADYSYYGKLR